MKLLQRYEMTRELLVETLIGKTMTLISAIEAPKDRGDLAEEAKKVREISKEILNEWKKASKPAEGTTPGS